MNGVTMALIVAGALVLSTVALLLWNNRRKAKKEEALRQKELDDRKATLNEKVETIENNANSVEIGHMRYSALELMTASLTNEISELVSFMDMHTVDPTERLVAAVEAISEHLATSGDVVALGRLISSLNNEKREGTEDVYSEYTDFFNNVASNADYPFDIVNMIVSENVLHGTHSNPETTVNKEEIVNKVRSIMEAYREDKELFIMLEAEEQIALAE